MKPHLQQSQKQHLALMFSPQMQRALHLLQLPVMELTTVIEQELEENPVLEYSEENYFDDLHLNFRMQKEASKKEDEDVKTFLENSLAKETSFFESLLDQAKERFTDKVELHLAIQLIGNLDEKGFLSLPLDEIALLAGCKKETLLSILQALQEFDPPGICAQNLAECLLLQLKRKKQQHTLAFCLVRDHFDALIHNQIPLIAKKCGVKASQIKTTIQEEILSLDFHPGLNLPRGHYPETPPLIQPDVFIKGQECQIEVNKRPIPSLRLNPHYLKMLREASLTQETKEYIHSKINSGKWLLRTLDERESTLYRISEIIVKKEREFLSKVDGKLAPLTMKEVAENLSLNESTIARAVANKYVSCQRGILPLRSFFTHAYQIESGEEVSVVSLKEELKKLIESEDKAKPFSDAILSQRLKEKGIPLARRTIAKYRDELGIGTVTQRKQHL